MKAKRRLGVSELEVVAELDRISAAVARAGSSPHPGRYTIQELCDQSGMGRSFVRVKINAAIRLGLWEYAGRVQMRGICGQLSMVPSYQPCKEIAKEGKTANVKQ